MSGPGNRWLVAGLLGAAVVALIAWAPLVLVLGASRLAVAAVLVTGAWISVRRLGSVDLGTAASALAGAAAGGVVPALAELPVALGLVFAAVTGAAVSAVVVGVAARVGRASSALTSLAVVVAGVALGSTWGAAGGRAGFHAVPLVTGSDRGDLVVAFGVLTGVLWGISRWSGGRSAGAASVAVRAAHVAASLGHRPVLAAARGGAVAGAVLGVGGWLQATATGSVTPGGYGLELSASLALAALIGGGSVLSGPVGALVVFGPAVIWPTAPIVGEAPVLVVGTVGLALLALRPGGLVRSGPGAEGTAAPDGTDRGDEAGTDGTEPGDVLAPDVPTTLTVAPTPLPGGEVSLRVEPGGVVALVGPNGSGKSTLLARIAGQLPDDGTVRLGDRPAPAGAVARAARGVGRSWQHPPELPGSDGLAAAARGPRDAAAADAVRDLLGPHAWSPAGRDLVRLAARRPAVALLDEPGAALPQTVVARVIRALADAGAAVLFAEHRGELVAVADRSVDLERSVAPRPVADEVAVPAVAGGGRRLVVEVGEEPVSVAPGDLALVDGDRGDRIVAALLAEPGAPRVRVRLGDRRVRGSTVAARSRRGLGVVTEVRPPTDVTVRDHLAAVAGTGEADRLLATAPHLAGRGADRTGVLSGGERRILSWLVCLALGPEAVVLDRSTAGLDPEARAWADEVVTAWRDAGVPVLVRPGRPDERRWVGPRR